MKLRNKKTGEMGIVSHFDNQSIVIYPIDENWNAKGDKKYGYASLAELNEEWEDYEEPKEDGLDNIIALTEAYSSNDSKRYPKEVVEKLKAVKRLKDKGFRFEAYKPYGTGIMFTIAHMNELAEDSRKDLDLLFGGEE